MAKRELIRIHSSGDDLIHIQPNGSHDPADTLCYDVDTNDTYTETNKTVTCSACKVEFNALKDGLKLVKI